MPTVRQYNQQVTEQALPAARKSTQPIGQVETPQISVRPTPEAFGAGIGQSLEHVGLAFHQEALKQREEAQAEADRVRLVQSERQLQDAELQIVYDPHTGALSKQGMQAVGIGDQVSSAYNKAAEDIRKTLVGDRQQMAFDQMVNARHDQISKVVLRHESQQMAQVSRDETAANLENSRSLAVLNADDPERVLAEIANQREIVAKQAVSEGWSAAVTQDMIDKNVSATHVAVIDRMLANGNDIQAKTYFGQVKKDIVGSDITKVEKVLEIGSTRGESQRQADFIMDPKRKLNLTEAMDEAAKITNPEVRDQVEQRIKGIYSIRKQQEQDDNQAALATYKDNIENIMLNTANRIDATHALTKSISPADWANLPIAQRDVLKAYAKAVEGGGEVETDIPTYYARMQEAADHPQDFARRNLLLDMHRLGKSEFKQLTELQLSIKKGDAEKADKELDGFRSNTMILNDTLNQAGMAPNPKPGSDEAKQVAKLHQMVDEQVMALQRNTGKKASNADVQGIVDKLLMQIGQPGSWRGLLPGGGPFFNTQKPAFEITPADIPEVDRKQIEAALRSQHRPVTDEAVRNLYLWTQQRLQQTKKKTGGP